MSHSQETADAISQFDNPKKSLQIKENRLNKCISFVNHKQKNHMPNAINFMPVYFSIPRLGKI